MSAATVLNLLADRRSYYAFSSQPIENDKLLRLLDAATQAPSSYNEQPWRYVVAKNGEASFDKVLGGLIEWNQLWSKPAPILVVGLATKVFEKNNTPNAHGWYDLGQSVANFNTQAQLEGLEIHQMAGFDAEKIREAVKAPAEYDVVVVFALGYKGDSNVLPDAAKERDLAPKSRKPVSEIAFNGEVGKPL
jgi:nitroreductase